MEDYGARLAEEALGKLEREYRRIYGQAAREMREKQRRFLQQFEREKSMRLAALDATEEAEKAYKAWLKGQAIGKEWFEGMVDELSRRAVEANESAMGALLDKVPGVYAGSANFTAYEVEKKLKARTAFTLVDEDTVRNLVTGRGSKATVAGRLLPEVTFPKVDRPKDYRWNRQKFTSAITQGILQGESIPNIVKRTESVFGTNRAAATRAARTAVGSAQNSGRYFSMLRAEDMGIKVLKVWKATNDGRTRPSHAALDGQAVPVKEPFESEHGPIDYPNDPAADPAETWNCRCSLKEDVDGFEPLAESYERWAEVQDMDYAEWEAVVASGKPVSHEVVEGKDILGTWKRRPDRYDFEIEDVMAAQGFDGKPRLMDARDFDAAVKRANGGDGLIMQRTYAAPNQATLDDYRKMLYDGKWYVDCSTGGAQYGRGMYCAADYTGELTHGIRSEISHYRTLNTGRLDKVEASAEQKVELARQLSKTLGWSEAEQDAAFDFIRSQGGIKGIDRDTRRAWSNAGDVAFEILGDEKAMQLDPLIDEVRFARASARAYTETMTLDPSARVVTYDNLKAEYARATMDLQRARDRVVSRADYRYYDLGEITKDEYEKLIANQPTMPGDMGSYAVSRGYDAINAVGHGQSGSYTVVLNRTKLIIRRP